jgi:hypothetical protein
MALGIVLSLPFAARAAPLYHVVDLTASQNASALGVDGNQQVGDADLGSAPDHFSHAVLWFGSVDSYIDLNPQGYDSSWANGIAGGQQVGAAGPSGNADKFHAMLWTGSAASAVDLRPNNAAFSIAYATNGHQQVGGVYYRIAPDQFSEHATLWTLLWKGSAASAIDLTPTGFTYATAVATSGEYQVGMTSGPATGDPSRDEVLV